MSPPSSDPIVTVVIPVYRDYSSLRECLHALENQSLGTDQFDVIVVDNGTPIEEFQDPRSFGMSLNLRIVRESQGGSYAARNAGINRANTEAFAFTDADCRPHQQWLETGVDAVRATDVGLVAGRVEVVQESSGSPNVVEIQRLRSAFTQKEYVAEEGFGATANLFTTRSVFDVVGAFRHELRSGGDKEWGRRVQSAGLKLRYAEDAVVRHRARATISELFEKTVRTAIGSYQVSRIEEAERRQALNAVKARKSSNEFFSDAVNGAKALFCDPKLSLRQKIGVASVSGIQQVTFLATQCVMAIRDSLNLSQGPSAG